MYPIDSTQMMSPWAPGVLSLVAFTSAVVVLMAVMLFLTAWLGDQRTLTNKSRPYESGIIPTGTARLRYPVPFFLVAIFFLIFDVEGAFIFSWAAAFRWLGWKGMGQIAFFIFVLLLGLVYIWQKGGLSFDGKHNRR